MSLAALLALGACDQSSSQPGIKDGNVDGDSHVDRGSRLDGNSGADRDSSADKGGPPLGQCATAAAWAKRFGSSSTEYGNSVAIDADSVSVTGWYGDSVDFGSGTPLINKGKDDAFVARFGCDGTLRWAKRLSGGGNESGWQVALDDDGNLYVVGYLGDGAVDLDGQPLSGTKASGLVCSFTSAGALRWCHRLISNAAAAVLTWQIAFDGQANIYLTLSFRDTFSLAGGESVTSAGGGDALLCSLTTGGIYRWCQRVGGAGEDNAVVVAAQRGGPIYFAAQFEGTAGYDGGNLSSAGGKDIALCRFTTGGKREWCTAFGGSGRDRPEKVTLDAAGNLYLTGEFDASISFGSHQLTGAGETSKFLVSVDSAGGYRWSKPVGGTVVQFVGDTLYLGGDFSGTADFDGQSLTSAGLVDFFVCRFTAGGERRGCQRYGGSLNDSLGSLAVASSGHLLLTGGFAGSLTLGPSTLTSAGATDIFLAHLAP